VMHAIERAHKAAAYGARKVPSPLETWSRSTPQSHYVRILGV